MKYPNHLVIKSPVTEDRHVEDRFDEITRILSGYPDEMFIYLQRALLRHNHKSDAVKVLDIAIRNGFDPVSIAAEITEIKKVRRFVVFVSNQYASNNYIITDALDEDAAKFNAEHLFTPYMALVAIPADDLPGILENSQRNIGDDKIAFDPNVEY